MITSCLVCDQQLARLHNGTLRIQTCLERDLTELKAKALDHMTNESGVPGDTVGKTPSLRHGRIARAMTTSTQILGLLSRDPKPCQAGESIRRQSRIRRMSNRSRPNCALLLYRKRCGNVRDRI